MLVLGRKPYQELYIWHRDVDYRNNVDEIIKFNFDITYRGAIKVAIDAPSEYKIYRKEIYERLLGER